MDLEAMIDHLNSLHSLCCRFPISQIETSPCSRALASSICDKLAELQTTVPAKLALLLSDTSDAPLVWPTTLRELGAMFGEEDQVMQEEERCVNNQEESTHCESESRIAESDAVQGERERRGDGGDDEEEDDGEQPEDDSSPDGDEAQGPPNCPAASTKEVATAARVDKIVRDLDMAPLSVAEVAQTLLRQQPKSTAAGQEDAAFARLIRALPRATESEWVCYALHLCRTPF